MRFITLVFYTDACSIHKREIFKSSDVVSLYKDWICEKCKHKTYKILD